MVETRDPKTGEVLRLNADDDSTTLGEMLRQERFGGGMADQKDLDAELAGAIMGDGKFEVRQTLAGPWVTFLICILPLSRTTWNTWTITPRNSAERRCVQMQ